MKQNQIVTLFALIYSLPIVIAVKNPDSAPFIDFLMVMYFIGTAVVLHVDSGEETVKSRFAAWAMYILTIISLTIIY